MNPYPPYPAGWTRGYFLGARKHDSSRFFPSPAARAAVARGREIEPYWHVMNFAPASRDSGDSQVLPEGDVSILALMATSDQADNADGRSYQSQLFQTARGQGGQVGFRFCRQGVNNRNFFGTARRPFFLRTPYFAPGLQPLIARVANVTTATNNVQVVLFGLRRRRDDGRRAC